ncbi:MAG: hypothetical protein JWO46_1352 [Nocardioidaceae bacterium]|nr:hypothetical protein [Nocardioidaceae bacterium]
MTTLLAPRYWGAHLLMVLAVAAATLLGVWQLHAWQDRRADARVNLTTETPVALGSVMGGDDPFPGDELGHPVRFSGSWIATGTVYVSDRTHDGRTGYWVVTPLKVDGTDSAMPVVRGWSPTASAPAPSGTTRMTGWLQAGEGTGVVDRDTTDDVVPELRIATLVQHVDVDLYGGYVIARTPTDGLAAVGPSQAPSVGQTTALRNFLYAIEWWVFGLFALVVWFRWCRDQLHPPRRDDEPDPAPADEPVTEAQGTAR